MPAFSPGVPMALSIDQTSIVAGNQSGAAFQEIANAGAQLAVRRPPPADPLVAVDRHRDFPVGCACGGAVECLEYGRVKSPRPIRSRVVPLGTDRRVPQIPNEPFRGGGSLLSMGIGVDRYGERILRGEAVRDVHLPGIQADYRGEVGACLVPDGVGR